MIRYVFLLLPEPSLTRNFQKFGIPTGEFDTANVRNPTRYYYYDYDYHCIVVYYIVRVVIIWRRSVYPRRYF
jgi:hypothetical protein